MAPRSFKKLTIAVSGTFPGYKQADLKSIIEAHGATFATSIGEECTYLVCTRKEVEKGGVKYQQACTLKGCEVVSLEWLLESDKARKPLAAKAYLLSPGGDVEMKAAKSTTPPKASKAPKGQKRKIAAVDADEDVDAGEDGVGVASKCVDGCVIGAAKEDAGQDTKAKVKVTADDAVPKKKQKEAQKGAHKALKVPVDDGCVVAAEVLIEDDGTIWDATLNQTNAANNNNKFYRIQLLAGMSGRYKTWTRWGRVGEFGSMAMLGDGTLEKAKAEFEKKFKDKSGLKWADRLDTPKTNKYTFIERNYEVSDDEEDAEDGGDTDVKGTEDKDLVESKLPQAVQKLLTFIFNQQHFLSTMASMSYDAQKMPLGKLSKRTLTMGFQILKDLSELVTNPTLASSQYNTDFQTAAQDLSNRYFTTIPHVFGRNRPPVLSGDDQIKREVELLEALTDMGVANEIMKDSRDADMIHQLDRQYQGLNMQEMTPLARSSTEFRELEAYLHGSRGSTHHLRYSVANIFRIERQGENDRFQASPYAQMKGSDRRLLWHGSRSTNFGGILSQGLRIAPPEAPVQGYMFGKGVYFADMSSKSANYCMPYNSANMGLLLLCDVEVGNPMFEQTHSNYNAGTDSQAAGKIATLGRGSTVPSAWKDAGCVNPALAGVQMPNVAQPAMNARSAGLLYNEYIVYDVAQIQQRYLFHVHMN